MNASDFILHSDHQNWWYAPLNNQEWFDLKLVDGYYGLRFDTAYAEDSKFLGHFKTMQAAARRATEYAKEGGAQ